ncbi:MAG: type I methionyl aminopeptidase, partial [Pseudomonadota bacterium]|nr:type I methionyl aminopeptidase [Pseudomonadota bacterium]
MTKTPAEIALMAEAGRRLAQVFTHLDGLPLEGMSTLEINDRVEAFIVDELKA